MVVTAVAPTCGAVELMCRAVVVANCGGDGRNRHDGITEKA